MKKLLTILSIFFLLAAPLSVGNATPAGDNVIINEVSSNGAAAAEWVELFNPTGSPIDVSGWTILDNTGDDVLPAPAPIPAGGYAVIVTNNTTVAGIPASAITITLDSASIGGAGLNNEGDELTLKDDTDTTVDEMNYGTNINVFDPAPDDPGAGETLSRIPNGVDTDAAADWTQTGATLGVTNSDGDGDGGGDGDGDGDGVAPAACDGIDFDGETITGTADADILNGTDNNDLIFALEGNDIVAGGGGDDCIVGGDGRDVLRGEGGDDVVLGEGGRDVLLGNDGEDTMDGGSERDVLVGGGDDDDLTGGDDSDVALGSAGTDTCDAELTLGCELP